MIVVSLDESGTFENNKSPLKLIGGIVCICEDYEAEQQRLEETLKSICNELSLDYPGGLHMMEIKNKGKREKLKNQICAFMKDAGNYYIIPFFVMKKISILISQVVFILYIIMT